MLSGGFNPPLQAKRIIKYKDEHTKFFHYSSFVDARGALGFAQRQSSPWGDGGRRFYVAGFVRLPHY